MRLHFCGNKNKLKLQLVFVQNEKLSLTTHWLLRTLWSHLRTAAACFLKLSHSELHLSNNYTVIRQTLCFTRVTFRNEADDLNRIRWHREGHVRFKSRGSDTEWKELRSHLFLPLSRIMFPVTLQQHAEVQFTINGEGTYLNDWMAKTPTWV